MVAELTPGELTVLPSFLAQLYRTFHVLIPEEEDERKRLISVLRGESNSGSLGEESNSSEELEDEEQMSPERERGLPSQSGKRSPHSDEEEFILDLPRGSPRAHRNSSEEDEEVDILGVESPMNTVALATRERKRTRLQTRAEEEEIQDDETLRPLGIDEEDFDGEGFCAEEIQEPEEMRRSPNKSGETAPETALPIRA
jgi:hypothetical protein